jgi:hypothetical protein
MKKLLVLTALASIAFGSLAPAVALKPSDLVGVWMLMHSEDEMADGSKVPYCNGANGYIIYTPERFVSVALNCGPRSQPTEPADVTGRKFFYLGSYSIQGTQISHVLENASEESSIGSTALRDAHFENGNLVLTGVSHGQKFQATWEKMTGPPRRCVGCDPWEGQSIP